MSLERGLGARPLFSCCIQVVNEKHKPYTKMANLPFLERCTPPTHDIEEGGALSSVFWWLLWLAGKPSASSGRNQQARVRCF